jgi:hypothetical protein
MDRMNVLRLHFVLLLAACAIIGNGGRRWSVNAETSADEYLYHTEEAAGVIIDYEPPKGATDKELVTPDFLYGPNQGPRVVEFYAPWCPHVRPLVRFRCRGSCNRSPSSFLISANIFARTISNSLSKSKP